MWARRPWLTGQTSATASIFRSFAQLVKAMDQGKIWQCERPHGRDCTKTFREPPYGEITWLDPKSHWAQKMATEACEIVCRGAESGDARCCGVTQRDATLTRLFLQCLNYCASVLVLCKAGGLAQWYIGWSRSTPGPRFVYWDGWWPSSAGQTFSVCNQPSRSTQPR